MRRPGRTRSGVWVWLPALLCAAACGAPQDTAAERPGIERPAIQRGENAPDTPTPLVFSRPAMGVEFQITLQEPDALAAEALARAAFAEVARLQRVLDNWSEQSDVSRLNATPGTDWVAVDRELADVLAAAASMHARTNGAYDVTVWPLVAAWGLVDRKPVTPDPAALAAARTRVGAGRLVVRSEPPAVRREVEGLAIDVSSLAKGRAVDRVIEHLRSAGVTSAFVAAGTSTVAGLGPGPDGDGWPFTVAPGITWQLIDRAVSTSGRSAAGRTDGLLLDHILDPRTGELAARHVRRAVFTGPSATEADITPPR